LHDAISIDPRLPPHWRSMSFGVRWRGRSVQVRLAGRTARVAISEGEPVRIRIAGGIHSLNGGASLEVGLESMAADEPRRPARDPA
jgi:trehalose/maltose hydrolase-like predicted phosphorylase